MTYCNLHCHTALGSNLDGFGLPELMARRAYELGQTALGITDHGSMSALVESKQACEHYGIKLVPGSELYITPWGKDFDWRPEGGGRRGTGQHLTVLAYNQTGFKNLLKLTQLANQFGFFHVPRISYEMLEEYNEGLIITSGCMASAACQALNPETGVTSKDYRLVNEVFEWALDVFGRDRYFIEIQDHDIPPLKSINKELSRINKRYDIEYITTNDSHYAYPKDAEGQADVMCVSRVNRGCTKIHPDEFVQQYLDHPDYYLTSYDDMKAKDYGFNLPASAFTNTLKVADMVEEIFLGYEDEVKQYRFPIMPEYQHDYDGELEKAAISGFWERYGNRGDDVAIKRLDYELDIIKDLGFSSYFLCIYDISRYCIEEGIPMTVRGSAGGSMVLYCLHVTDFCPLEYGLIFERFLNPDRVSAPDADLDIDPTRRDDVIKYLVRKYGEEFSAQVITHVFIRGHGAIRSATRILELPYDVGDALVAKMNESDKVTVSKTLDRKSDMYVEHFAMSDVEKKVVKVAVGLEGQVQTTGIHAGAVMLSDRPLVEDYPLMRPKTKSKSVTKLLVGYNYETAESIGGIKIDVLGVVALGILYNAMEMINQRHGTKYSFETLPVDDPISFELINSGDLAEIFQLAGHAGAKSTGAIKPQTVQDVMVASSICRPGPNAYESLYADRMHGRVDVDYPHPDLEPVLKDTYGIMLFQEGVMRVSKVIAGFTNGQADILRKAISKKKGFEKIKILFIEGAKERGHADEFIEKIWSDMKEFNGYGFNMPHACAYARIAVKQAYLKARYPIEYYAAAMTGRIGNDAKLDDLLKEMIKHDIKLLPPQLGLSATRHFTIDDEQHAIRYPYGSIKNVGKSGGYLKKICLSSIDQVTPEDLKLFKRAGKRSLETLAMVGAFDHLFENRNEAVRAVPYLSKGIAPIKQATLLKEDPYQYTEADFLAAEREFTGLYLTGHPLDKYTLNQPDFSDNQTYEGMKDQFGLFIGVVKSIRLHRDSKGDIMAFLTIEDKLYNEMSVVIFSSLYGEINERICVGCVVKILGKINVRFGKTPEEDYKIVKYGRVSIVASNVIGEL